MGASNNKTTSPGLRERKKAQTRQRIQESAMRLFLSKGYDATTVEEIAAAADVSPMTFFRYFPTKESVVEQDDYDPLLAEHILRRPPDEAPLNALRQGMLAALNQIYPEGRDLLWQRTRLMLTTPALRAHFAENQFATQQVLVQALGTRGPDAGHEPNPLGLRVQAAAFLAAVMVALDTWVQTGGAQELPDLIDQATRALVRAD